MPNLIQLRNVDVLFGKRKVLDNISLNIKQGKITTLIGQNGAGKSTLVKTILGLQKVSSGSIDKQDNLKIGYVPQKLHINELLPLTVIRFLMLAGNYDRPACTNSLQLLGATHLLEYNIHNLSGGEMQRILLARALLHKPQLLILDEPTQGVDLQGQIELYELISQLRDDLQCAIFMVSHDLHFVMAKTDEVICLHHHICCMGSPTDIITHPAYLSLFGYNSSQAVAIYHHNHSHHHNLAGDTIDN